MFLAVNYQVDASKIREDSLDGRDYWVVPVASLTPGVHTGNNGALLYDESDISRSVPSWNNKPIVVYHPKKDGKFISAANKETLEKSTVGFLLNSRYDGKLRHEAWIDKAKAVSVDSRVADAIKNKTMMEVSTGLFHDLRNVSGTWNDESYTAVVTNMQPDHLALLPDEIGACSIKDGAGLLQVNSKQEALVKLVVNEISQNQLFQNLSKSLIQTRGENSWLYEVYDKYFIYIQDGVMYKVGYSTAKDDSLTIDFSSSERVQEKKTFTSFDVTFNRSGQDMTHRNEAVTKLITNSAYSESDREWLTALDDAKFQKVTANTRPLIVNSEATPAVPAVPAVPAPAPAPVTLQSYVDAAPADIKAQLSEALATMNSTRTALITSITSNAANVLKPEVLQTMTTEALQGIVAMTTAKPLPTANTGAYTPPANYAGQAPTANAQTGSAPQVTGLGLPSMFPPK